jgi:hypothetical protein
LGDVLTRDNRFVDSGLGAWMLASKRDSATQLDVRERHQLEAELAGMFAPTGLPTIVAPPTLEDVLRRLTGRPGPPAVRRTRPVGPRRHTKRPTIHQVKVTLKGARPPIWRRLLVRSDITLDRLHEILQTSFGWFDYHLHAFVADGLEYGAPDVELDWPVGDERTVTLADVAPAKQCRVLYRYDFGDDWEHDVLVEVVIEPEAGAMYPQCIKGKRASPPEDVGGVWGYAEFLEIMADPAHPEHEERLEWAGGEFDPEEFDLAAVNEALQVLSAAWG